MADKVKKIRKPMYAREEMSRLVKWFFGLPLIYVIWLLLSLVIPVYKAGPRMTMIMNIVSYAVFIFSAILVIVRFLKFPFKKMLNKDQIFNYKNLFAGFIPMLVLGTLSSFLWMLVKPQNFTYCLKSGWPVDFLLSLVLITLAAFLEELLCRAYITYFINDEMESRTKQKLLYCLASATFFTILHFQNPEVSGSKAIYSMTFYFIMGFALMAVSFKTGGIEAAIGIHLANNLTNAWFFSYEDSALITNSIFIQKDNIGPWMVVQAVLCTLLSVLVVVKIAKKQEAQNVEK